MASLYLLRHGIAVPAGTPGFADDERPLTSVGRQKMRQIARGLAQLRPQLDRIITSPLPRARETAEIVASGLGLDSELEESDVLRVDRAAEEIAEWLAGRTEPDLMLVGHNPNLSDLIGLLTCGRGSPQFCVLRRGGLAVLAGASEGGYRIDWVARPRLLRRLG
jgi:phosphohistidine phosphatase